MTTIEDLNKTQIILLTLLMCFVVSIATGIITVSLLEQAPTNVTQTINRVVERTVETVLPPSTTNIPTKDLVRLQESEATLMKIEEATKAIVTISLVKEDGSLTFNSIGVMVNRDGLVATDNTLVKPTERYVATLGDNTNISLTLLSAEQGDSLALFRLNIATSTATTTRM